MNFEKGGAGMRTYTPADFASNLVDVLARVADMDERVAVALKQATGPDKQVVLISEERYTRLTEIEFLLQNGTLATVTQRMMNEKPGDFDEKSAY